MDIQYIAHVAKDEEGKWLKPHSLLEHLEKQLKKQRSLP